MNGFALATSKNSVIVDTFQKMPTEWSEATQANPYISTVCKRPREEKVFCHFPKPPYVLPNVQQSDHAQQKRNQNSTDRRMTEKDMKLIHLERNTHILNFGTEKTCLFEGI